MISKEQFVAILKTLEETDKKENRLNDAMTDMNLDFYTSFYPTQKYKSIIIDLLNLEFYGKMEVSDYVSDVEYFIYDLNYGKNWKEDSLTDSAGNSIDISTSEKLYDYLTKDKLESSELNEIFKRAQAGYDDAINILNNKGE